MQWHSNISCTKDCLMPLAAVILLSSRNLEEVSEVPSQETIKMRVQRGEVIQLMLEMVL